MIKFVLIYMAVKTSRFDYLCKAPFWHAPPVKEIDRNNLYHLILICAIASTGREEPQQGSASVSKYLIGYGLVCSPTLMRRGALTK